MNWNAIGALGQWFAGFATLLVVIYAIRQDYWKRPKLMLSFDNDRDVKSQANTVGWVGLHPTTLSRWLRVRVQNTKRRKAAKNCRVFLIGIEAVKSGEDKFPNDIRQLRWTHDHSEIPSARDLLPGVFHWVDVAGTIDGQSTLVVHFVSP